MKNLLLGASFLVLAFCTSSCKKCETTSNLNITHEAAYVVNGGDNNLSVLDLGNDTKVETIALNCATLPHHIYLSADKKFLAVAITATDLSGGHSGHGSGTSSGYKMQVINALTGEIHHELSLTKLPHNGIFSADGKELWVTQADATESSILIFETTNFSQIKEIKVGKGLSEVTFSSDKTKVYAANTTDATISVIDPAAKTVTATLKVEADPVGAWAATNGNMYVDNETGKSISEIDVATNKITATIPLGYKPAYAAYNDKQKELWVTDADGGKVVYYKVISGTWTKQGDIATGADAHAIVFTADGKKAYISNQGAASVSVIKVDNHTKIKDITVGSKPNGIALKQ